MAVFLLSNIEDSAKKWEQFHDAMAKALVRYDDILQKFVTQFGGSIIKTVDDQVFALFDNRNTLKCALTLQEELKKPIWDSVSGFKVCLALHAVDMKENEEDRFNTAMDRAACVLAATWGGQTVVTPEALEVSDKPEGAVVEDLGVHLLRDLYDPRPLLSVASAASKEKFEPLRTLTTGPNNLTPQSTPFFGRADELKRVDGDLKDPTRRMITLLGQGGIGKTRLALQAAAQRAEDFAQGVYYVSLASVTNPEDLVLAVAGAVKCFFSGDMDANQQLLRFLKDRSCLLILDGFEHLLIAGTLVDEILSAAPKVKVIVTSRSRLNLLEEKVIQIDGLASPKSEDRGPVADFSAVKFFLTCAQRVKPQFELSETEGQEVAQICRLLGGVPLAIELAAAWVKMLSCQEIKEEIEVSLDFLESKQGGTEKNRSLRAVFEYSWSVLTDGEKKMLMDISVFQGGFLAGAAEKIADCPPETLADLVDKSLLQKSYSKRYEMHEMIRQFAEEKLKDSLDRYQAVRGRHTEYFCNFLAARETGLKGPGGDQILKEIAGEYRNVLAAWKWAVGKQDEALVQKAYDALFNYFEIMFLAKEGEEAFALAAAAFSDPDVADTPERQLLFSMMLARQGWFVHQQGRMEKAEALIREGLALARELKQARAVGECLHYLCPLYSFLRRYEEEEKCAAESLEIFQTLNDEWCVAWSLFHMAQKPKRDHENEKARKYFLQSVEIFRRLGYRDGLAWNLTSLGQIAMLEKDYEGAKKYFNESLGIFEVRENKVSAGMILLELAHLCEDVEDFVSAYVFSKRAYESFQSSQNRLRLAWAQFYCADCAYNMGDWEDSLGVSKDALRLFSEEEDLVGQGWTYANLCRAYNAGGQFEEGSAYGVKSVEVFTKIHDMEGVGAAQYYLAFSEMGLDNLTVVEPLLLSAMEKGMARDIHWRVVDAILGLAELKLKLGDVVTAVTYANILLKDREIGKDQKKRTQKLLAEKGPLLDDAQIQQVEKKAGSFTTQTLSAFLTARPHEKSKATV